MDREQNQVGITHPGPHPGMLPFRGSVFTGGPGGQVKCWPEGTGSEK